MCRYIIVYLIFVFAFCASVCPFAYSQSSLDRYSSGSINEYKVKKGDTLSKIGRKFGLSVSEILVHNPTIENPNYIFVGQVIVLPAQEDIQPIINKPVHSPKEEIYIEEEEIAVPEIIPANDNDIPVYSEPEVIYEIESDKKPKRKKNKSSGKMRNFVGAEISYWMAGVDAKVRSSTLDVIGTLVDLEDDLGVDSYLGVPVVELWVKPVSFLRANVSYMSLKMDGGRKIEETIAFGGYEFTISEDVRGELEVKRFSGDIEWHVLNGSWGYVGPTVGGEYVRIDGELSSESAYASLKDPLHGGTVTVGGVVGINLPYNLSFEAAMKGISLEISGVKAEVLELEACLNWTVAEFFCVSAGYRSLTIDASKDEDEVDLTLSGPEISGSIRF
ncbi:MAG: LysM domain-containing protein [Candidatus Theseobacter exili]|nr:LysM domain-containing protein [Candidatus Theseobacter exili]